MREQKFPYFWLTLTAILGTTIAALSIAAAPFTFYDPLFPNMPNIAALSGLAVGSVTMGVSLFSVLKHQNSIKGGLSYSVALLAIGTDLASGNYLVSSFELYYSVPIMAAFALVGILGLVYSSIQTKKTTENPAPSLIGQPQRTDPLEESTNPRQQTQESIITPTSLVTESKLNQNSYTNERIILSVAPTDSNISNRSDSQVQNNSSSSSDLTSPTLHTTSSTPSTLSPVDTSSLNHLPTVATEITTSEFKTLRSNGVKTATIVQQSPSSSTRTTPPTPHSSHPTMSYSADKKEKKKKCLEALKKSLNQATNGDERTICNNIIGAIKNFGANAHEISRILNTPNNKALIPGIIHHLQKIQNGPLEPRKVNKQIKHLIRYSEIYRQIKEMRQKVLRHLDIQPTQSTLQTPKNYSGIRATITRANSQPVKLDKSSNQSPQSKTSLRDTLTLRKIPSSPPYDKKAHIEQLLNAFKNQNNIAKLTDELLTVLEEDPPEIISFTLTNGLWNNQLTSFQINFIIQAGINRKILDSYPSDIKEQITIKRKMEDLLEKIKIADNESEAIKAFMTYTKENGVTLDKLATVLNRAFHQDTINENQVETICRQYYNILPPSEIDAGYWKPPHVNKELYLTLRNLVYKPLRKIEKFSLEASRPQQQNRANASRG